MTRPSAAGRPSPDTTGARKPVPAAVADRASDTKTRCPVDWKEAQQFTRLLHGKGETEWRLIHPQHGTRRFWGDLNDISDPTHPSLARLQRLNAAGFNVYQVVNRPNQEIGRRKIRDGLRRELSNGKRENPSIADSEIRTVSALFVEIDREDETPGANLAQLRDAEMPPSFIVQSSTPNKVHGYWLVCDMPLDLWLRLQPQMPVTAPALPQWPFFRTSATMPGFMPCRPLQNPRLLNDRNEHLSGFVGRFSQPGYVCAIRNTPLAAIAPEWQNRPRTASAPPPGQTSPHPGSVSSRQQR